MPVTVKNYAGNICKDNPRLFNILQVSFLKEKADFLKKDIPFHNKLSIFKLFFQELLGTSRRK